MLGSVALLVCAGLLGPLLAAGKKPLAPVLVGELVGGALVGKAGFHLIDAGAQPFPAFATLGLAMLMLGAGTEVDLASKDLRQGAGRAALAMLAVVALSIPAGLLIGAQLHTKHPDLFIVLLAGSSAAVAFPTIQELGLSGRAVSLLVGWITLADALTALVMPLTLTGAGRIAPALAGDVAIVAVAASVVVIGHRLAPLPLVAQAKRASKRRHWALQLRVSVLLLLALGAIAEQSGASLLVAGFAAGMVLRQFHEPRRFEHQLTGLANGFFVPAFFVLLGATLDLRGLVRSPSAIGLALGMAVAATAVHVAAALIAGREKRLASGLLASAQLGLPAAAAGLGLSAGVLTPPVAAAIVAAGCLTLIPASVGARLLAMGTTPSAALSEDN